VFNDAIARAQIVQKDQRRWYDMLVGIYTQAGTTIVIDRVYIQSGSAAITINAHTGKEEDAIEFNRRLEKLPQVARVEFPLTSIERSGENTISFRISITMR
jgi:hypothetical protein